MEVNNIEEILHILDTSKVLHLGLVDDGMPYVVPMNYGYIYEDGKLIIYLHGAVKGYKLDVIRKNPVCCFSMECDVEPFAGKVPCQYGTAYYSLMGKGEIHIVEDGEERLKAMHILMKTQADMEYEFTERLISAVSIMRIDVDSYTAKHRPFPAAAMKYE